MLRLCALGVVLLLAGAVDAGAEVAPGPAQRGDSSMGAGAGAGARVHGRKGKKRRRLRRKAVKPTKFQNVTPHQHLGPGISR